jgi:hypothetical protein
MPASRFVGSMLLRGRETFLYTLKAGRGRPPQAAARTAGRTTTGSYTPRQ